MSAENKYVIGLDYGTDSVRCVLANAGNGTEVIPQFLLPPMESRDNTAMQPKPVLPASAGLFEGWKTTIKECLQRPGQM